MRRVTMMTTLLTLAATLGACAPSYDGFDCRILNETPSRSQCSDLGIEVARGEAMVVRLSPRSDTREDFEGAQMELRTTDPQSATVRPGTNGDQTIIGLTAGETTLEVYLDGDFQEEVPLTVALSAPSGPSD